MDQYLMRLIIALIRQLIQTINRIIHVIYSSNNSFNGFDAGETAPPSQCHTTCWFRWFEGYSADQFRAIRAGHGARRQNGDTITGRHHATNGPDGMTLKHGSFCMADVRTRIKHLLPEAVACLENQHIITPHFIGSYHFAFGPRMFRRNNDKERFIVQGVNFDTGNIKGQRYDGGVHCAIFQIIGQQSRCIFFNVEGHFWCRLTHGCDQLWKQVGTDGVDHPKPEFPD